MGISVLSFIEIMYYFTLLLGCKFRLKKRIHTGKNWIKKKSNPKVDEATQTEIEKMMISACS